MVSFLSHVTIDAHDPYAQSVWWSQVLGYAEDLDDPNEPGHEECMIFSPEGSTPLLFIEVPDDKHVKNRLHLDLRPSVGDRDAELARLLALGARQIDDRRLPDGGGWVVLADPEGNEFCILRSLAEVQAQP
jgi:predicted enzyme related to lactoylglutathione lyase